MKDKKKSMTNPVGVHNCSYSLGIFSSMEPPRTKAEEPTLNHSHTLKKTSTPHCIRNEAIF